MYCKGDKLSKLLIWCDSNERFYCLIAAALLLMIFVLSVQAFKPVVWKSLLSPVTPVEFLLDRQLDFLSDHSAYQPYQVMMLTPKYTRRSSSS